ncbi:MAG: 4-(cytidine 5'-diphospho)-2-C-methyl-D-erythritol kinase [Leptospiraceae bacterium]|nr:4-(cytidine 5'-diphospho)-2-C-methyl-D-erythritol kinase [Leptospiraceae bacterium]MCB1316007.1 4-(cytidine 5'-diphospho)-2-C-methyl-D-erythritol kinase [Leptospiraceae bacterium]
MTPRVLESPAKINLGLQVHHRRAADGYHFLTSIFVPISFHDTLTITPGPASGTDRFTSTNHLIGDQFDQFEAVSERGDPSRNLIWRALEFTRPLRQAGLHVHLEKRIPAGGGLGGGSSNAGVLLRYIGQTVGVPTQTLQTLAVRLGADVPFFLTGRPALVYGIGELQEDISIGPGYGVLCIPPQSIITAVAYSHMKRTLQGAPPPKSLSGLTAGVRAALTHSEWKQIGAIRNDFEGPVFEMFPFLGELKSAFYECGADYASLSGSGSTMYALVKDEEKQKLFLEQVQRRFSELPFRTFRF